MQKENEFVSGIYETDWDENLLIFCIVMGDGDYLAFKFVSDTEYEIVDGYHDALPQNWKTIGTDIEQFLGRMIDEGGRKFYLE